MKKLIFYRNIFIEWSNPSPKNERRGRKWGNKIFLYQFSISSETSLLPLAARFTTVV